MTWQTVALGEVLTYRKEFIQLDDNQRYVLCRVQWYGQGVIERGRAQGFEIKTKTQQVCKSGDFIVAEIDAKEGGFGIVPPELEGAIVSSHYFLFEIDQAQLDPAFLGYYVRLPTFREQVAARGSTNYSAVRPNHVLNYTIPLPPLAEQRRIVAKIERLAGKVEEARGLRRDSVQTARRLESQILASIITGNPHLSVKLADLIAEASYGTSVKCDVERHKGSIPVLRIPNVATERVNFSDLKYGILSDSEHEQTLLQLNDLLIVRTNGSSDLVGRCAVVSQLSEPTGFASYLIRIRPKEDLVDSHYLQRVLRYSRNAGHLFDLARTTAGQYNVSLGRLRSANVPLPSLNEQRDIVSQLDCMQSKVDRLIVMQDQTAAELDALLPAILDRAFKGKL